MRLTTSFIAAAAALSLVGCTTPATEAPNAAAQTPSETSATSSQVPIADTRYNVTYETGPCYGTCPVYKVVVSSDGRGQFTGIQHTAVSGEAEFAVSREQFDGFVATLEPYRPAGEKRIVQGEAECPIAATDSPTVKIRWRQGRRTDNNLTFYYGCRSDDNRSMAIALQNAPGLLPIGKLIGK